MREAINSAIDEEMSRDDKVFIIGNIYTSIRYGTILKHL